MERIGDFVVLSYHDVRDAASLHEKFKKRSICAAVIDSAYIVSRLHLVVALHRLQRATSLKIPETGETLNTLNTSKTLPPAPRDAFAALAALAHTRNLDRVLQRLTCGEATRAVVIVLSDPQEETVAAVIDTVEGVQHGLDTLEKYCEAAAVRDFYGVGESEAAALEVAVVNRLATSDI